MNDAPRAGEDALEEKRIAARKAIRNWSSAAAAAILQPLSVIDVLFMAPLQHRMVRDIGRIHGYQENENARHHIFKTLRGKRIKRSAVIVGAKCVASLPFVPFVGNLVGMAVAYAFTHAIGELSNVYFAGDCTMSDTDMVERFDVVYKEQYERAYKHRRDELRETWRTPAIRRRDRGTKEGSSQRPAERRRDTANDRRDSEQA